jgi:30S ribosome assembly GTPase
MLLTTTRFDCVPEFLCFTAMHLTASNSTHELLTPARFQELLSTLRTTPCLIVYIVDIFDFHGSFLYNLPKIVGENPVVIAANKVRLN